MFERARQETPLTSPAPDRPCRLWRGQTCLRVLKRALAAAGGGEGASREEDEEKTQT